MPIPPEKITLLVEAPSAQIASSSSGLNVALRKLGAIDRMLVTVTNRYAALAAAMGKNPFGRSGPGGGPAAFASPGGSGGSSNNLLSEKRAIDGLTESVVEQTAAVNDLHTIKRKTVTTGKPGEEVEKVTDHYNHAATAAKNYAKELNNLNRAANEGGKTGSALLRDKAAKMRATLDKHNVGLPADKIAKEEEKISSLNRRALAEERKERDAAYSEQFKNIEKVRAASLRASSDDEAAKKRLRAEQAKTMADAKSASEADIKRAYDLTRVSAQQDKANALSSAGRDKVKQAEAQAQYAKRMEIAAQVAQAQSSRRGLAPGQWSEKASSHNMAFTRATNDAAAAQERLNKQLHTASVAAGKHGKNLLDNTIHVTSWAASVAVLYGSLGLARASMVSMIATSYQMARLTQVFRGNREEIRGLSDDIMRLASINGRSTAEAMESSIQWARLGLSRVQILTAVRTAMIAANVAEMTTAEATDHLSSMMQAFRLRVGELPGVLGQLNNISNTYNVTNKQLLQGISRVAGVAAQAKIPLTELMGIIALSGATGQTGPNFGNAIKSIIGSLSNKDTQKLLREDYGFEATSETLKPFSDMLSELFVKYQSLEAAEQQSMIFSVAGKNQASRMTTILNNYVQAQVLSIQAQLNLNSAEKENLLIKATMKARLAGLVAEWERFVALQARAGQDVGLEGTLGRMTLAMTNVLRFANLSGVSLGIQLISLALVGMTAKLLVTGIAMATTGGIVRNTIGRLSAAFVSFRAILGSSIISMGLTAQKFAQITVNASGTIVTMNLFRSVLLGLVSGMGIMLAVWVAVEAAMWAWNHVMEKLGVSSDKATSEIDKFSDAAERSEKAATAASQAIRLIATAQAAIKGMGDKDPVKKAALLNKVAEIAFPSTGGMTEGQRTAEAAKTKELQEQLRIMQKKNDLDGISATLNEISARWAAVRKQAASDELAQVAKGIRAIDDLIRDKQNNKFINYWNPDKTKEDIDKLKEKRSVALNRSVSILTDTFEENEQAATRFLEIDKEHRTVLESMKKHAELIGEYYRVSADGGDRLAKFEAENRALEAQAEVYRKAQKAAEDYIREKQTEGLRPPTQLADELQVVTNTINEQNAIMDAEAKKMEKLHAGRMGGTPMRSQAYRTAAFRAEMAYKEQAKLNKEIAAVENSGEGESLTRKRGEVSEFRTKKIDAEIALEASRKNLDIVKKINEAERANRLDRAQNDAFKQGETEGEGLHRQKIALQNKKDDINAKINSGELSENQMIEARNTLRATEIALLNNKEAIEKRILELEQEMPEHIRRANREWEKGLLGAGPAELLRKLAVTKMGNNPTAGQVFSMDPAARQDYFDKSNFFQGRKDRQEMDALRPPPPPAPPRPYRPITPHPWTVKTPEDLLPAPETSILPTEHDKAMDIIHGADGMSKEAIEAEFESPGARTVGLGSLPAGQKLFDFIAGKMGYSGPAPDGVDAFGNSSTDYNYKGFYDPKGNRVAIQSKTLGVLADAKPGAEYEEALGTLANEFSHYIQDMLSGDPNSVQDFKGVKERVDKWVKEGLGSTDGGGGGPVISRKGFREGTPGFYSEVESDQMTEYAKRFSGGRLNSLIGISNVTEFNTSVQQASTLLSGSFSDAVQQATVALQNLAVSGGGGEYGYPELAQAQ